MLRNDRGLGRSGLRGSRGWEDLPGAMSGALVLAFSWAPHG